MLVVWGCPLENRVRISSYLDPMFNCAGHFTILTKRRNAFGAQSILRRRTLPCRAC